MEGGNLHNMHTLESQYFQVGERRSETATRNIVLVTAALMFLFMLAAAVNINHRKCSELDRRVSALERAIPMPNDEPPTSGSRKQEQEKPGEHGEQQVRFRRYVPQEISDLYTILQRHIKQHRPAKTTEAEEKLLLAISRVMIQHISAENETDADRFAGEDLDRLQLQETNATSEPASSVLAANSTEPTRSSKGNLRFMSLATLTREAGKRIQKPEYGNTGSQRTHSISALDEVPGSSTVRTTQEDTVNAQEASNSANEIASEGGSEIPPNEVTKLNESTSSISPTVREKTSPWPRVAEKVSADALNRLENEKRTHDDGFLVPSKASLNPSETAPEETPSKTPSIMETPAAEHFSSQAPNLADGTAHSASTRLGKDSNEISENGSPTPLTNDFSTPSLTTVVEDKETAGLNTQKTSESRSVTVLPKNGATSDQTEGTKSNEITEEKKAKIRESWSTTLPPDAQSTTRRTGVPTDAEATQPNTAIINDSVSATTGPSARSATSPKSETMGEKMRGIHSQHISESTLTVSLSNGWRNTNLVGVAKSDEKIEANEGNSSGSATALPDSWTSRREGTGTGYDTVTVNTDHLGETRFTTPLHRDWTTSTPAGVTTSKSSILENNEKISDSRYLTPTAPRASANLATPTVDYKKEGTDTENSSDSLHTNPPSRDGTTASTIEDKEITRVSIENHSEIRPTNPVPSDLTIIGSTREMIMTERTRANTEHIKDSGSTIPSDSATNSPSVVTKSNESRWSTTRPLYETTDNLTTGLNTETMLPNGSSTTQPNDKATKNLERDMTNEEKGVIKLENIRSTSPLPSNWKTTSPTDTSRVGRPGENADNIGRSITPAADVWTTIRQASANGHVETTTVSRADTRESASTTQTTYNLESATKSDNKLREAGSSQLLHNWTTTPHEISRTEDGVTVMKQENASQSRPKILPVNDWTTTQPATQTTGIEGTSVNKVLISSSITPFPEKSFATRQAGPKTGHDTSRVHVEAVNYSGTPLSDVWVSTKLPRTTTTGSETEHLNTEKMMETGSATPLPSDRATANRENAKISEKTTVTDTNHISERKSATTTVNVTTSAEAPIATANGDKTTKGKAHNFLENAYTTMLPNDLTNAGNKSVTENDDRARSNEDNASASRSVTVGPVHWTTASSAGTSTNDEWTQVNTKNDSTVESSTLVRTTWTTTSFGSTLSKDQMERGDYKKFSDSDIIPPSPRDWTTTTIQARDTEDVSPKPLPIVPTTILVEKAPNKDKKTVNDAGDINASGSTTPLPIAWKVASAVDGMAGKNTQKVDEAPSSELLWKVWTTTTQPATTHRSRVDTEIINDSVSASTLSEDRTTTGPGRATKINDEVGLNIDITESGSSTSLLRDKTTESSVKLNEENTNKSGSATPQPRAHANTTLTGPTRNQEEAESLQRIDWKTTDPTNATERPGANTDSISVSTTLPAEGWMTTRKSSVRRDNETPGGASEHTSESASTTQMTHSLESAAGIDKNLSEAESTKLPDGWTTILHESAEVGATVTSKDSIGREQSFINDWTTKRPSRETNRSKPMNKDHITDSIIPSPDARTKTRQESPTIDDEKASGNTGKLNGSWSATPPPVNSPTTRIATAKTNKGDQEYTFASQTIGPTQSDVRSQEENQEATSQNKQGEQYSPIFPPFSEEGHITEYSRSTPSNNKEMVSPFTDVVNSTSSATTSSPHLKTARLPTTVTQTVKPHTIDESIRLLRVLLEVAGLGMTLPATSAATGFTRKSASESHQEITPSAATPRADTSVSKAHSMEIMNDNNRQEKLSVIEPKVVTFLQGLLHRLERAESISVTQINPADENSLTMKWRCEESYTKWNTAYIIGMSRFLQSHDINCAQNAFLKSFKLEDNKDQIFPLFRYVYVCCGLTLQI